MLLFFFFILTKSCNFAPETWQKVILNFAFAWFAPKRMDWTCQGE